DQRSVGVGLYQGSGRCGSDEVKRELRRPVGIEQAVGLLVRVGELRVAGAAEDADRVDDREQFPVSLRKLFRRVGLGVAPRALRLRARDASEFRQHDWLILMFVAVEYEQPPGRTLALEQARNLFSRRIASCDALGIAVVVVNADDVGGDAFPAVVA